MVTARLLERVTILSHLASRPGSSCQDGEYWSRITTKPNDQVAWASGMSLRSQPSGPRWFEAHHRPKAITSDAQETETYRGTCFSRPSWWAKPSTQQLP